MTDVQIPATEAEILVGGITNMNAAVLPKNATDRKLSYGSNHPEIATVDEAGSILGVSAGKAIITAKSANGVSASMTITVVKVSVTGFTISENDIEVGVGCVRNLTPKFTPENATNKKVTWTTSDETVATVDGDGKVTGVKVGNATITATAEDGGFTVACQVNVVPNDGIDVKLLNPYQGVSENNTILYGDSMEVAVDLNDGDQPVRDENVVLTLKSRSGHTGEYEVKNKSAVTNEQGRAVFVVGMKDEKNNDSVMNEDHAGSYTLVATRTKANDNSIVTQKELPVNVATISVKGIDVVSGNINPSKDQEARWKSSGYTEIDDNYGDAVYYNGVNPSAKMKTYACYKNNMENNAAVNHTMQNYVVSQKVSHTNTSENQLKFGVDAQIYYGQEKEGDRDSWSWDESGEAETSYVYNEINDETYKTISIRVKDGVNSLRVNFKKINLSAYTEILASVKNSAGVDVEAPKHIRSSANVNDESVGKQESIQFGNLGGYTGLTLVVSLVTKGQVMSDGEGFAIASVIGTYDTEGGNNNPVGHPLSNVTVNWKDVSHDVQYETIVVEDGKTTVNHSYYTKAYIDQFIPTGEQKDKYTIKVPVFPYSGDAYITAEGGYTYVYPTQNARVSDDRKQNLNVNRILPVIDSIGVKPAIRVTNSEEAENRAPGGAEGFSADDKIATVNSYSTGMTALEAKVTIPGVKDSVFNDQNGALLYTSVQWAPVTSQSSTETTPNDAYYAVEGQTVRVVAQLYDDNNNRVTQANEDILFTAAAPADFNNLKITGNSGNRGIYVVDDSNGRDGREGQVDIMSGVPDEYIGTGGVWKTDVDGKVVVDFEGIKGDASVKNLDAKLTTDHGYTVKLSIIDSNNVSKDIVKGKSDIYWVDLGLAYQHSVEHAPYEHYDDTSGYGNDITNPESKFVRGKDWKVGYYPIWHGRGSKDGVSTNGYITNIKGLELNYDLSSDDITINDTNKSTFIQSTGNEAKMHSDEIGRVNLIGSIKTAQANLAGLTFIDKWGKDHANVGRGQSYVAGDTKLVHVVDWMGIETSVGVQEKLDQRWTEGSAPDAYIGLKDADGTGKGYPNVEVEYWVTNHLGDPISINATGKPDSAIVSANHVIDKTANKDDDKTKQKRGFVRVQWILNQLQPSSRGYRIEARYTVEGKEIKASYTSIRVDEKPTSQAGIAIEPEVEQETAGSAIPEAEEYDPNGQSLALPVDEGNEASVVAE